VNQEADWQAACFDRREVVEAVTATSFFDKSTHLPGHQVGLVEIRTSQPGYGPHRDNHGHGIECTCGYKELLRSGSGHDRETAYDRARIARLEHWFLSTEKAPTPHPSQTQLAAKLEEAARSITVDGRYVHYKNAEQSYVVRQLGIDEATDEVVVVYQAQYGAQITYTRPAADWFTPIVVEGRTLTRFIAA
jgi:hypothetical protein